MRPPPDSSVRPPLSYDALVESAEDAVDRAEMEAARLEDDYVPWEEVKAGIGLR